MTEILILGGGYAGLRALKQLNHAHLNDAHVTLVNKHAYHYQATELHLVAAGTRDSSRISFSIPDVMPNDATFIEDEVVTIDRTTKTVTLAKHDTLKYDYLIIALGFQSETFGIKGADTNALPLEDIHSAQAIAQHIDARFAAYAKSQDVNDLSIIVCGAGFTSIELLGELADKMPQLVKKYDLPADKIKVECIEAMPSILPMFNKQLAQYAQNQLEKRGIKIWTGTAIGEVKANSIVSGDKEFFANTIIWTTGVSGSHVIADSSFDQKRNRVIVNSDLSDPNYPEVFILGDVSAAIDPESNRPYPTTAQIAIKMADTAVENLVARENKQTTKKFTYASDGTVCSLGESDGIAEIGASKRQLKGYPASVTKKIVADRALLQVGHLKQMVEDGHFDLYH